MRQLSNRLTQCPSARPSAPIFVLFLKGGPAAVLGAITFGVVDAINRMPRRRTLTHIIEICDKGILPTLANRNATASIVNVGRAVGIITALNHTAPNSILARFTHPMLREKKASHFFPKATTTHCASTEQAPLFNLHHISAETSAHPGNIFRFSSYGFKRCEPAEFSPWERSEFHISIIANRKGEKQ